MDIVVQDHCHFPTLPFVAKLAGAALNAFAQQRVIQKAQGHYCEPGILMTFFRRTWLNGNARGCYELYSF
jgi:hypothetical protein